MGGASPSRDRLVVRDETKGGAPVQICCVHFSGSAKRYLFPGWLHDKLGRSVRMRNSHPDAPMGLLQFPASVS